MKPPFVRSAYNYDTNAASDESGLKCQDPTLAQQNFAEECDINTIVERFKLTGTVPQLEHLPSNGDFTGIFDYQTAMNAVVAARETFDSLPAKIRARFNHDPHQFVAFCDDKDNLDEAIKLGIARKPESTQIPSRDEKQTQQKQGDTPATPKT